MMTAAVQHRNADVAYAEIRDKIATIRTPEWHYVYNLSSYIPPMIFPFSGNSRAANSAVYFDFFLGK